MKTTKPATLSAKVAKAETIRPIAKFSPAKYSELVKKLAADTEKIRRPKHAYRAAIGAFPEIRGHRDWLKQEWLAARKEFDRQPKRAIILGVTGSIAAHKAADLASLLTKQKCRVSVVMTADAQRFITPLPFKVLTRQPVVTDLYDEEEGWPPAHIRLADDADLLLIAPATANVIAKLAHGIADDALTCIALALNPKAKIQIAPAMNGKMWLHPATQKNAATLKEHGVEFIGPDEGMLSCGYEGIGRLWPVEKIAERALKH